jgi:spermidine synthase
MNEDKIFFLNSSEDHPNPCRQLKTEHQRPFVYDTPQSKTLYFSICDIQSKMLNQWPYDLALEYTRLMMAFLLFVPDPRHIAIVGLGGGSLAKFCYRYLPDSQIDVIEINPHIIALRNEFKVPKDDHRFRIHKQDAADFVRITESRYDVMLSDGFDRDGLPASLCSRTFYDNCFDLLKPNGAFVANLHSDFSDTPNCIERLKRSFDGGVLVVKDIEQCNLIAFASRSATEGRMPQVPQYCVSPVGHDGWRQLGPSIARVREAARKQRRAPNSHSQGNGAS